MSHENPTSVFTLAQAGKLVHEIVEHAVVDHIRHHGKHPKEITITRGMGEVLEALFRSIKVYPGDIRESKKTYFGAHLTWDAPEFTLK